MRKKTRTLNIEITANGIITKTTRQLHNGKKGTRSKYEAESGITFMAIIGM